MTAVRRMIPADAAACGEIIAELPYFFPDAAGVENAARDVRANGGWVTQDEGLVTGFLCLAPSTPETLEVAWMAVRPSFRRQGRGRILVERAMDDARARGARMLVAFVSPAEDPPDVEDGFEATRRFYAKMGFVPLMTVKPEGWADAHLLLAHSLQR